MIEVRDLLSRFDNILLGEEYKMQSIYEALNEVIGIEINKKDIRIKNNTIYLGIKPIFKNELSFKKEEFISVLSRKLGEKAPDNFL